MAQHVDILLFAPQISELIIIEPAPCARRGIELGKLPEESRPPLCVCAAFEPRRNVLLNASDTRRLGEPSFAAYCGVSRTNSA